MLYHLDQYISNDLTKVFEPAIGQRVKYTVNTGRALISVANANLNGAGTMVSFIVGASNGTLVENVTIQAVGNTTRGMVRLFIYDVETVTYRLIAEIDIPECTISAFDKAFSITLQTDFILNSLYGLAASTEKAESFHIIAEGLDTVFP